MKTAHLAALVIGFISVSQAVATITVNSSAPTLDGADQGNMTWSTTGADSFWTDRPNPGQSFTTGSNAAGYTLTSFSYQLNSSRVVAETMNFTMRVVSISGSTSTTLHIDTGVSWNGLHSSGDWATFTFSAPVALAANTLYGVDLEHTSGGNWPNGITSVRRNGNTFAGGTHYTKPDGNPTSISTSGNDRIFHVDMTAIPEPSSLALAGLGGLLLLRRRR